MNECEHEWKRFNDFETGRTIRAKICGKCKKVEID